MAQENIEELRARAQQIKDETTTKANTALRVGAMLENQNDSAINAVETADQVIISDVEFQKGIDITETAGGLANGVRFNGNTKIYEFGANNLKIAIGGVDLWNIFSTYFTGNAFGSGTLASISPGATVAAHTFNGDLDTGWGRAFANKMTGIAGGIEGIRISIDQIDISHGTVIGGGYANQETPPANGMLVEGLINCLEDKSSELTDLSYIQKISVFAAVSASIQLPEFIDAVNGEVTQIYYSSMISFPNWERFYFAASLDDAKDLKRYIELEPTSSGDLVLLVNMYDENNVIRSTGTTTIRVRNSVQQPASTVNYWNVGDSLTADTTWSDEMFRRLTGTGGTPVGDNYGNIVNNIEGNAGRDWSWYVNNEASPFVYSGVLDFEQYRIDNGLAVPQALYILMTWNGMAEDRTQAEWDTWDDNVYTFIDALRSDFPSVEVKLMSPHFASQNGGLGFVSGADVEGLGNILLQNRNASKQAEIYERIKGEASYSSWVEHINTALVVDSKNNMPSSLMNVNTRNSSVQELIGVNNVHPLTSGYYQIADAAYRNFIVNYCQ